jgi:uncharacterized membrane protein YdjX (TVP38/TMEM64 family)
MSSSPNPPASAPPAPRPSTRGRWALAIALLLLIVLFYALGLHDYFTWDYLRGNLGKLETAAADNLLAALLLYVGVYTLLTALSLPAAGLLSLLGGDLFGLWLGVLAVSVASTLGASLAFLTSRYLFRDWVQRRFGPRLQAINRGFEADGAWYLFTLRLVPVFPFFLINLAMGLTPMRLRTFWWVSQLGMLPATFVIVNAGRELRNIATPRDALSPSVLLSLSLLALVPLLLRWALRFVSRRFRRPA